MASFNATFFPIFNSERRGRIVDVPVGRGAQGSAELTTSGTAQTVQRASVDWVMPSDGFVYVHCDGDVRVAVGETAAVGASPIGHFVPSGLAYVVSVAAGETISVIDA